MKIVYLFLLLVITSCVTEKKVRKYIANHPEFVVSRTDTVLKRDTTTRYITLDTVFSVKLDTINEFDTVIAFTKNKPYKGSIVSQGIAINYELTSIGLHISANFEQKTILITKTVNNGKIITVSKPIFNFPWYIILFSVSLSLLIIYLIIKKIIS